ncbi:hypothetical protein PFICI_03585 [Pestalotiopsis fici W106-1]|uniref:DUF7703 domain-containing protein n=1 Tax=Pestalotiopsis fici (strain W106-1 / CGMCC3.15140) TaxID=1229662 RepID=W3XHQ6_PESFW|nr:uncharacterized protein PFICI_03585 [Pestalotiopsis fici W106-1]ETS85560.1 hypothetical protein PFICI_03585 [Pestalotiopsis fici W106-1]
MGDINVDLQTSMTMAAFIGISWYIGIEVNLSLLLLFKRRRGLYFWSCALTSWGVILQPIFIILADYGIWRDPIPSITMIYLTWLIMVVPQGWVLYSRLHLLLREAKVLRAIRLVLIFNSVAFSIPTIVIGILAQSTTVNESLVSFNIVWDRVQLVVFFVQETALSILYIYQTRKYLHDAAPLLERSWSVPSRGTQETQNNEQKSLLRQLIWTNILIIALDISLLGIQCADLFYVQGAFKPCVYGIKLKAEFVILNRLINNVQRRANGGSYMRTGSESNNSAAKGGRHTRIWHKRPPLNPIEDPPLELGHWNGENEFRLHSRGSQAPILSPSR